MKILKINSLVKFFHYGLHNNSMLLISIYFSNRAQTVKYNNVLSPNEPINLRVPQGSLLGPLFFQILINDLAFITEINCKMFADDTNLYMEHENIDRLISIFKIKIKAMTDWCSKNKLDINWTKTYFMFITNKRITLPKTIVIEDSEIVFLKKLFKNSNCSVLL